MFTTLLPSMCPRIHSLPMYSGDFKVKSLYTVTALLETTYDWFQTLDSGKEVCAVFFDIKKAFDIIPLSPTAWLTDSIINATHWQQRSHSLSLNSWMYPSSQAHMTVGYSQLHS